MKKRTGDARRGKGAKPTRPSSRAPKQQQREDALPRRFDGRATLDGLLAKSGALGDVDDVVQAFRDAVAKGVPPQPVILALWEDEPRFTSPADAEALFSNLLGLYELVASGQPFDLGAAAKVERTKKERAPAPPLLSGAPDDDWLEGAWRYLEDAPRERERLGHAFDNRQDPLVSVLDASGLSDAGFAFAREVAFEVFSLLEVGGRRVGTVHEGDVPEQPADELPEAFVRWVDDGLVEAEAADEQPLPEAEQPDVRDLTLRVVEALWRASQPA
ncbi:MAG: hypothetical protein JNJ54_11805 [Myxococcaceae bacterium]|nr:hypothetical protein [Myxococcaceae bacterium]